MAGVWTIKQMKEMGDLEFAIAILNERAERLNPYAPLSKRIAKAVKTLEKLKAADEKTDKS